MPFVLPLGVAGEAALSPAPGGQVDALTEACVYPGLGGAETGRNPPPVGTSLSADPGLESLPIGGGIPARSPADDEVLLEAGK